MNRPWYQTPPGLDPDLWQKAVEEVAYATGDREAIVWVTRQEEFWNVAYRAGILVGAPKPPPEEQEALYAELDRILGVT